MCTSADCYVEASACEAGAAAKLAVARKMVKYSDSSDQYTFYQVAAEAQGLLHETTYFLGPILYCLILGVGFGFEIHCFILNYSALKARFRPNFEILDPL